MKLKIRPLQQGKGVFVVEAEPSETIHDLKLRISEHGFPVQTQNLLNTGNTLQDDKAIGSYGIKEASTLVLMLKAPSAIATPSANMSNSPRVAPGTLSTPPTVPGPASASRLAVPSSAYAPSYATPAPVPPVAAAPSPKPISGMAQGPAPNGAGIYPNAGPSQSNIDSITAMGFSQDQAVRALRASDGNVDQAVEFLINDPHNLGADSPPRVAQAPNTPWNGSRLTNGTGPQTNGLPQSSIPQNLTRQRQQDLPDLSSMSLSAVDGPAGGGGGGSGGATAEVSPEQIEEIRRLVASNPILIGPLLEQFKQEDPELYNRVGGESALTNPEKLLRVLGEGGDYNSGPTSPPPPALPPAAARLPTAAPAPAPLPQRAPQPGTETQTITVTREEHEDIERIVGMGFEKQVAVQAYMACDKSVERAVEFLVAGAFE